MSLPKSLQYQIGLCLNPKSNKARRIKPTGAQVFFMDTRLYFNGLGSEQAEYRMDRMRIKAALGITDERFDHELDQMLLEASYGGHGAMYFSMSIGELEKIMEADELNTAFFINPHFAIIDIEGGSGAHRYLKGHTCTMALNPENLFLDKALEYNYTYGVCCMDARWCRSTQVSFSHTEGQGVPKVSAINQRFARELEYEKTFSEGGCTYNDKNPDRHRHVEYQMDYPCGNKCLDCNTFWID